MLTINNKILATLLLTALFLGACGRMSGPAALFKKMSPHDVYADKLKSAGLESSALGSAWLSNANNSINRALNITIPYKETGYFNAEKAQLATFKFDAIRGQKLRVVLQKRPAINFDIYIDLFIQQPGEEPKRVAYADILGKELTHEVDKNAIYYLRLQPELLSGGEYTLTITAGPSLSFPVSSSGKPRIGSFWGDGRDDGGRKHEGVDIFATKGTPAIAAANGRVTSVTENKLGGRVVFMRPDDKDYILYYAHLDAQLKQSGDEVRIGDTLGLVGNTGNAQFTPSHLHFGIYTSGGAIDPIKFIDKDVKVPQPISASLTLLNATSRVKVKSTVYSSPSEKSDVKFPVPLNTPLQINSATGNWFKVTLPDGQEGFVENKGLTKAGVLKSITIKNRQVVYAAPDTLNALPKGALNTQAKVSLLGTYKNYSLVSTDEITGWVTN